METADDDGVHSGKHFAPEFFIGSPCRFILYSHSNGKISSSTDHEIINSISRYQGSERLSTFDDIGHWELEEPLAVVPDKFLEQLPRDAVLELTEPWPTGQPDATFIKSKHVLERVELIESLVAYGGDLGEQHLTQRFQSIS